MSLLMIGELAPRQPGDDVALGRDHAPQARHLALFHEDLRTRCRGTLGEHRLLELLQPLLELLDLGTVAIDHGIHDAMEQRHRPLAHDLAPGGSRFPGCRGSIGNGHRGPSRDNSARRRSRCRAWQIPCRRVKVDPVQNQIEIPVVRFDLGIVHLGHRVLDRQGMEPERVGKDQRLGDRGSCQIDPYDDTRAGIRARRDRCSAPAPPCRRDRRR